MATLIVPDVNVLVGAFHRDASTHEVDRTFLQDRIEERTPVGVTEAVAIGLLRIATHARIFSDPAPTRAVVSFLDALLDAPGVRSLPMTSAVRARFAALVAADPSVRGNLVPDAWIAATALAHGGAVATHDHGFARFDGLEVLEPSHERPTAG